METEDSLVSFKLQIPNLLEYFPGQDRVKGPGITAYNHLSYRGLLRYGGAFIGNYQGGIGASLKGDHFFLVESVVDNPTKDKIYSPP